MVFNNSDKTSSGSILTVPTAVWTSSIYPPTRDLSTRAERDWNMVLGIHSGIVFIADGVAEHLENFTSNNIISWSSSFPCCHLPLCHCSPISTVVLCSLSLSLIRILLPLLLHYNLIPWWYHEMKRTKEKLSISFSGKENIQSLYLYLYSIPFLLVLILLVPFHLIIIVEQNRLKLICDRAVSPPTYPPAHILMWKSSFVQVHSFMVHLEGEGNCFSIWFDNFLLSSWTLFCDIKKLINFFITWNNLVGKFERKMRSVTWWEGGRHITSSNGNVVWNNNISIIIMIRNCGKLCVHAPFSSSCWCGKVLTV